MADGAQKFFIDPFAISGDKSAVPDAAPLDGSVSYDSGWGVKYQQNPAGTGLNIPRVESNQIMFDVTQAIQILQMNGFAYWISAAANGGTPFPYAAQATCRHNGVNYFSLIDNNTDEPPTSNWGVVQYNVQTFFPGDTIYTYNTTLPPDWLWVDGKTIGSAASGATGRASADTINLFTVLWNGIPNSVAPIQNSDGSAGVRGASPAADFAANKRFPLIDERGTVPATADNLGGTPANVLNNFAQGGVDGKILGNRGGEANHAMVANENGTHGHTGVAYTQGTPPEGGNPLGALQTGSVPVGGGFSTSNSGLGQPHNTVQPTVIKYCRIKL